MSYDWLWWPSRFKWRNPTWASTLMASALLTSQTGGIHWLTLCVIPQMQKETPAKSFRGSSQLGILVFFSVSRSDKWLLSLISIDKHCFFHPLFSFGVDVPDVPQPYCTSNPTVSAHGLSHHRWIQLRHCLKKLGDHNMVGTSYWKDGITLASWFLFWRFSVLASHFKET